MKQRVTFGAVLCIALSARAARAERPGDAQARNLLEQAVEVDYLNTRFDDAEHKLRTALDACGSDKCSPAIRVKLHLALGSVLSAGKRRLEDAKDAFIDALRIDPSASPDPMMATTESRFAYEAAREELGMGGRASPPKNKEPTTAAPAPAPTPKEAPPKEDADRELRNLVSAAFIIDFAAASGTDVCAIPTQNSEHVACFRQNQSRYQGTPTLGVNDTIHAGLAPSTMRVVASYDRVMFHNFTGGLRLGLAFNGAPSGAQFIPLHAEVRVGYWIGRRPFAGPGFRPFLMASGGFGQVDTRVDVEILEDGETCRAPEPSNRRSPCTVASRDGRKEPRVQSLDAYKQTGFWFVGASAGLSYAPIPRLAVNVAARGSVMLPVSTLVLSPEAGVSVAF